MSVCEKVCAGEKRALVIEAEKGGDYAVRKESSVRSLGNLQLCKADTENPNSRLSQPAMSL